MILAGAGTSTDVLRNYLHDHGFADVETLMEERHSKVKTIRARWRRHGVVALAGQVAFAFLALPLVRYAAKSRHSEIMKSYGLRTDKPIDREVRVQSINDPEVVHRLQERRPQAVIVNGTRIIREHVLSAVDCPYINIHCGITPAYRGVHGGYWALWSGDGGNFGATIHLVDRGVDTGPIARHVRTSFTRDDNFSTYPLVQLAAALPGLLEVLQEVKSGSLNYREARSDAPSRQWYHPTLFQYLSGLARGVK